MIFPTACIQVWNHRRYSLKCVTDNIYAGQQVGETTWNRAEALTCRLPLCCPATLFCWFATELDGVVIDGCALNALPAYLYNVAWQRPRHIRFTHEGRLPDVGQQLSWWFNIVMLRVGWYFAAFTCEIASLAWAWPDPKTCSEFCLTHLERQQLLSCWCLTDAALWLYRQSTPVWWLVDSKPLEASTLWAMCWLCAQHCHIFL